jgi:outer membrane protein TolC
VAAAEAQHGQAMSGYWPHVGLKAGYTRLDQSPNFVFPASNMYVPAQTINVPSSSIQTPGMMMTIPANAFGPGFPPQDVQFPVPPQTVNVPAQAFEVPAQQFPIPEQDIKLMDKNSWFTSLNAQWLLWDGGMRKGIREQAQAGIDAAREELRRTDLEIVDSVKRLYHGAVVAHQVRRVGEDTLARMEATLSLTETMYKEGAGRVKKTDYLDNKVMVETLRSAVALLEKNESMAQAALAYTIGFAWNESVSPAAKEIPFEPTRLDLEELVSEAYEFSPDWKRLEAGIRAAEGAEREAKSAYYPKLALTGELHKWWNDYGAGLATEVNKQGWMVGVGVELPIFNGFQTREKVREARGRLGKLREERFLLQEGIGLQVRTIVLGLVASQKQYQATLDAMTSATENRKLNTRAYQNELVETGDVIRAQLVEALMSAQHYKTLFDHAELRSKLNLVVGQEVSRRLASP